MVSKPHVWQSQKADSIYLGSQFFHIILFPQLDECVANCGWICDLYIFWKHSITVPDQIFNLIHISELLKHSLNRDRHEVHET